MQHGNNRLGGRLRCDALDSQRHDFPGPVLALLPSLCLDVTDEHGGIAAGIGLDHLDKLGTRLGSSEPGDGLQRLAPFLLQVDKFGPTPGNLDLPSREIMVPGLKLACLFVNRGRANLQALFTLDEPGVLCVELRSQLPHLRLGLHAECLGRLTTRFMRLCLRKGRSQRGFGLCPFLHRPGGLLGSADKFGGLQFRLLATFSGLLGVDRLGRLLVIRARPGRRQRTRAQYTQEQYGYDHQTHEQTGPKHSKENTHRSSSRYRPWPASSGPERRRTHETGRSGTSIRVATDGRVEPKRTRRRLQTPRSGPSTLV